MDKKSEGFGYGDFTVSNYATVVGEISNSAGGWNTSNIQTFLNMLANSNNASIDTLESLVDNGAINSETLRSFSSGGKDASKSLVLTVGGIEWIVTYVSRAKESCDVDNNGRGDIIATLWMADTNIISKYEDVEWCSNDQNVLYSESYVRKVSLNQVAVGASEGNTGQDESHVLREFTLENGKFMPYIVTPEFVSWQESEQYAKVTLGDYQDYNNENWSTNWKSEYLLPGYSDRYNYCTKQNYSIWKNDTIWLPSATEAGSNGSKVGLWATNQSERANSTGHNTLVRSVGLFDLGGGDCVHGVLSLSNNGAAGIYADTNFNDDFAIRPAFHLNLSALALTAMPMNLILDNQNGGDNTVIEVCVDKKMKDVTIPNRTGYTFGGYYTQINGGGIKYYNENGTTDKVYPLKNRPTTLYAYWIINYNVLCSSAPGGKIIIIHNGMQADKSEFTENSKLNFYAIANSEYSFLYWQVEGVEISQELLTQNPLEIVLTTDITLRAVFGASLEGVKVSATKGGMAYIVGDDFDSLGDNDLITIFTKICLKGYEFSHWVDNKGNIISRETSLKLKKSEAMDKAFTAIYYPTNNPNLNLDTNN